MPDSDINKAREEVKKLNTWLTILVGFCSIYVMVVLTMIASRQSELLEIKKAPTINVDPITLNVPNTNIIHPQLIYYATNGASNVQKFIQKTEDTNGTAVLPWRPMFQRKANYEVGDYVIVSYFQIPGIVVGKETGDKYTVMYRDHNRTLQKISLPADFLIVPTSNYAINPLSLLID